jgi:hypothetical protein
VASLVTRDRTNRLIVVMFALLVAVIVAAVALMLLEPEDEPTRDEVAAQDADTIDELHRLARGIEDCYATTFDYAQCPGDPVLMRLEERAQVIEAAQPMYVLQARSPSGTVFEARRHADGALALTCTKPGTGRCTASGGWTLPQPVAQPSRAPVDAESERRAARQLRHVSRRMERCNRERGDIAECGERVQRELERVGSTVEIQFSDTDYAVMVIAGNGATITLERAPGGRTRLYCVQPTDRPCESIPAP